MFREKSYIMKMLLLGGTGAIGLHLSELAALNGWEVHVTSRKVRENSSSVSYFVGDASDDSFLIDILKGDYDVVVDFMIYRTEEFRNRVSQLLGSCGKYIFLSSARVYANSATPIVEESPRLLDVCADSAYLATDEYALTKARQEDLLFESDSKNWSIVRPYITYSEQRLQLGVLEKEAWLFRVLEGKGIVFSQEISEHYTTLTYGRDVAKSILAICNSDDALGEVFNPVSDYSIKWSDVLEIYLKTIESVLGRRPEVTLVTNDIFMEIHRGRYQFTYDRLYDRVFNNQKISNLCRVSNAQAPMQEIGRLQSCLKEFLKRPTFSKVNWASQGISDRITAEKSSVSAIRGIKPKIQYLRSRYFN